MTGTYILHLETSSTVCSVSIAENGNQLYLREEDNGFTHAEHLHVFIENALKECSLKPSQLSAIAVGAGPGSYTGLRIGMSAAKGLCYALSIPLISIGTLRTLSVQAKEHHPSAQYYIPLIDARRMEVYYSVYTNELKEISGAQATVIDEDQKDKWKQFSGAAFFGSGMDKCRQLLDAIEGAVFIDGIKPTTKAMHEEAFRKFSTQQFEDVAYSEPLYAKEFYDTRKDQKE